MSTSLFDLNIECGKLLRSLDEVLKWCRDRGTIVGAPYLPFLWENWNLVKNTGCWMDNSVRVQINVLDECLKQIVLTEIEENKKVLKAAEIECIRLFNLIHHSVYFVFLLDLNEVIDCVIAGGNSKSDDQDPSLKIHNSFNSLTSTRKMGPEERFFINDVESKILFLCRNFGLNEGADLQLILEIVSDFVGYIERMSSENQKAF